MHFVQWIKVMYTKLMNAFEALPKGYGRHLEMLLMRLSRSDQAALYADSSLDAKSERKLWNLKFLRLG